MKLLVAGRKTRKESPTSNIWMEITMFNDKLDKHFSVIHLNNLFYTGKYWSALWRPIDLVLFLNIYNYIVLTSRNLPAWSKLFLLFLFFLCIYVAYVVLDVNNNTKKKKRWRNRKWQIHLTGVCSSVVSNTLSVTLILTLFVNDDINLQ